MIGVGWFVAAVLILNVVDSDFSRIDNMISEYANGDYGWLMQSAFLGAGIGTVAIAVGIHKALEPSKLARVSVVLLYAAGIGFFLALERTNGWLHLIGSVIVFFAILFAVWTLWNVFRRDRSWEPLAKTQLWFAIAYTTALIVLFGTLGGPGGLTQRISVLVMMGWLITLAWNIQQHDSTTQAADHQSTHA